MKEERRKEEKRLSSFRFRFVFLVVVSRFSFFALMQLQYPRSLVFPLLSRNHSAHLTLQSTAARVAQEATGQPRERLRSTPATPRAKAVCFEVSFFSVLSPAPPTSTRDNEDTARGLLRPGSLVWG